ncbi:hypothetical protein B0H12DRAFT_1241465, partial [Mycena haematopus]
MPSALAGPYLSRFLAAFLCSLAHLSRSSLAASLWRFPPQRMLARKRKKATTLTFGRAEQLPASAKGSVPSAGPSTSTQVLREKTTIRQDGSVRQDRSVVTVATIDDRPPAVHPDMPRLRDSEPIYEPFTSGDHDGYEDVEEDGGRDLRESDNPLRQWAEDHRDIFLAELLRQEGRGDHVHCLGGGELLCSTCIVEAHRQMPFHRIQQWTGSTFKRRTLKEMGLRIQLGHWQGSTRICPLPMPAPGDDFVIVDNTGVHQVSLDYSLGGDDHQPEDGRHIFSLRRYHLLSLEAKCSALEFYQSLARETDNLHYKKDKNRYHEFLRMTRQWRHIQMLKRTGRGHEPNGVANTRPATVPYCALPVHTRESIYPLGGRMRPRLNSEFLYGLFVGIDANFRLKRKDVSTEEKDPGLGNGWAFFCNVNKYMAHVKKHWKQKQERSHCVAHDAVDKPDREARGTASSGIGTVDCARHNMKRPNAVGDLQLGERYLNMDYIFFRSIAGSPLRRFFVSYDIACQWHINIWTRMEEYDDADITIDGEGKFMTFLVPKFHLPAHIEACNLKFSFNLTRDVGQTDGEAPERGWANANPLARSTKEMGP